MGDLDVVLTGLGPGPFTGLRVGVVTAAALADARGLPVVGVCSLDAIGSGARTVVTDPRRKEIYWAAYRVDGARVDRPPLVRPEEVAPPRPFVGAPPLPAGPAVARREVSPPPGPSGGDPAFAARLGAAVVAADVTRAGLLRAAAPQLADPSSAGPLTPLYLRRPDATPPTAIKAVSQA